MPLPTGRWVPNPALADNGIGVATEAWPEVVTKDLVLEQRLATPAVILGHTQFYTKTDGLLYYLTPDSVEHLVGSGQVSGYAVDYYEGDTPPYRASLDVYGFEDAASLVHGSDMDVIFKFDHGFDWIMSGVTLMIVYAMSTAEVAKTLRLRLDYIVHNLGELFSAGTPYGQDYTIAANANANTIAAVMSITIPNGHVTTNTREVECRLTRKGTDVNDTHLGDMGIKNIVVLPT